MGRIRDWGSRLLGVGAAALVLPTVGFACASVAEAAPFGPVHLMRPGAYQ